MWERVRGVLDGPARSPILKASLSKRESLWGSQKEAGSQVPPCEGVSSPDIVDVVSLKERDDVVVEFLKVERV